MAALLRLLAGALLPLLALAAKAGGENKQNRGIDAALSLRQRNSVGPFKLTGENFTAYATQRPRLYHVGLFFTAGEQSCSDCPGVLDEYAIAASLFNEQYNVSDAPFDKLLYFFVVSVEDSPELFHSLGITYVPQLFVIGPKSEDDPKQPLSDFAIDLFEGKDLVETMSASTGVQVSFLVTTFTKHLTCSTRRSGGSTMLPPS